MKRQNQSGLATVSHTNKLMLSFHGSSALVDLTQFKNVYKRHYVKNEFLTSYVFSNGFLNLDDIP